MTFVKWPSIKKFSDVYVTANRNHIPTVTLRGKIKLHGSNAAIRISNGELIGQKRSSDVTIGDDNAGFAAWLDQVEYHGGLTMSGMIFFGEWAGPGVQQGDAVADIGSKKFFVFAAAPVTMQTIELDPQELEKLVSIAFRNHPDIFVLPWYTDIQVVRIMDQDSAQTFIDGATALVDSVISQQDPYIKEKFGVEGPGEGIVYYALDQGEYWAEWMFKVKSQAHTVNKSKKRNHVAPERPDGIDDFIDRFFTEARFQQMLDEHLGGVADRKNTGDFIRAVMTDAHKESVNEIELADFEWQDVAKYSVTKTRVWFFDQTDKL
jgi:hypothetical protein